MAATPAIAERILAEHAASAARLPSSVVAAARRRDALSEFTARGVPHAREENWKYANLRALELARFRPAALDSIPDTDDRAAAAARERLRAVAEALPAPIAGYARYVVVDGAFEPTLSSSFDANAGVQVSAAASRASEVPVTIPAPPNATQAGDERFARLNEAFAVDGLAVSIAPGVSCTACVEVIFVATAEAQSGASYPRLDVRVGAGARLGLIERHVSIGSDANFVAAAVTIETGDGGSIEHYRVQQTGTRATWVDTLVANLARDSSCRLCCVNLGAQSARSTIRVRLAGERAQLDLHTVSVADQQQVHDVYALVEHCAPQTRTDEIFRGIAGERARVAFNGKIAVDAAAHGADSKQSLRGLLAGARAEIDTRPQLEIYTDDVRCSHGATVGKLDETMLFYLLARGIDRDTAERLLKWAFLEDVIARIAVPELRTQIEQSLPGREELG